VWSCPLGSFPSPITARLWVRGYHRDYAGNLVAAGHAYSTDGKLALFIAIKSPKSADVQLIRTYPYWPAMLAIAPDGTIWTTGIEMTYERELTGPGVNSNGCSPALRSNRKAARLRGSPKNGFSRVAILAGVFSRNQ